jgi:hypothetical protein
VDVTVVEIAGGRAYLQPGATAGVRRTAKVVFKGKEYVVTQSSDSYAVIDLGDDALHEKDKGRATVVAAEEEKATELPAPRPLSTWDHAWAEEEPPASSQQPAFVPLGGPERSRRLDVRLSMAAGGIIPLAGQQGGAIQMGQLDARVHYEPWAAPMAFDFDGAVRQWAAADMSTRVGGPTRSVIWVRQMLASYGAGGWYAGLGRMPYAAATLGTLDGARVAAPLGAGVSIGAFGGFLPNPVGGELAFDAQRFGVEARWARPDLASRPEAALVAHGSTFQGSLDERRVSGVFGVYPGPSRFGGHFEVSAFDPNNPWKASPVEVTGAGVDQSVHVGPFDFGSRFDILQPERSRWLASYLPAAWFCITTPAPAGQPTNNEPCNGSNSTRALGVVTAGVTLGDASLTLGATAMGNVPHSGGEPDMVGGFVTGRVVRIARALRIEASGNYTAGSYLDMIGGTAGPGVTLLDDALDVSAYYRIAMVQYASGSSTYLLDNGAGGAIVLFPDATMLFTLQGEGMTGNDVSALFVLGTVTWHPRL